MRRLRAAFEKAAVGMFIEDAGGRVWESNRAFRRMLGYGEDEFRGMARAVFTHPDDAAEDAELYAQLLRGERGSFQLEKRYVGRDGSVVRGRLSASLVEGGGGDAFVLGVVEDMGGRRETEEALRVSEERFRTIVEQSPLSIHVFEPGGRSLKANTSWNELWSLEEGEEPEGHSIFEDEQLRHTGLIPYIEECIAGGVAVRTPPLLHDPARTGREGPERWLEASVYPVKSDGGDAREIVLIIEDVSERHRAGEEVRRAEARFRAITEGAAVGIALTDLGVGRLVETNPALRRMLGYSEEELRGMGFADFTHPDDVPDNAALFEELLRGERDSYLMEKRYVRKDGGVLWGRLTVSLIREERGRPRYVVGIVEDVTERKALEERLRHRALHDGLTDLPNRQLFVDRLGQALARPRSRGGRVTVLVLDLDNFKHVNDSLGHGAGDRLLVAVAERLRACVRPEDTVAQLGGDEFAVLLGGAGDEGAALRAARRIAGQLEIPFRVGGREVPVLASIGISLGETAGASAVSPGEAHRRAETLLGEANAAVHEAKRRGKAQHAFYEEKMGRKAGERLRLENDLRRATKRGEFEVLYQPKVELGTGRVVGAEALVRWRHPDRGLVSPLDFIPLAEETGLIVPVGVQVLRAACEQARAWRDRWQARGAEDGTGRPPVVWVNLSARQLGEPDLVGEICRILVQTGLEPQGLGLEVTESVLMGDGVADTARLEELKALGVMLAIDDFGTGYSSLSYLKRLPVDYLKVDRSFVAGLGRDAGDAAIVAAVVGLGRAMGLGVVAEGVETEEQLGCLGELGCEIAQGYLFARPMPGPAVPARLAVGEAARA